MRLILTLAVCSIVMVVPAAMAAPGAGDADLDLQLQTLTRTVPHSYVHTDRDHLGNVVALRGLLSEAAGMRTVEAMADQSKAQFGPALGFDATMQTRRSVKQHAGGTRVRYEQMLGPWRVVGHTMQVHLDKQGRVVLIDGRASNQATLPSKELPPASAAMELAARYVPGPVGDQILEQRLELDGENWSPRYHIINMVDGGNGLTLGYRTVIDAQTGALIYGAWAVDHADYPANAYLVNLTADREVSQVTLQDLTSDRNIVSDLFQVFDGDYRESGHDGQGGFSWLPEQNQFTYANVYYHVSAAHNWVQDVLEEGSGALPQLDRTAWVVVNAVEGDFNGFVDMPTQYNAFFSAWSGPSWIYFFGAGGNLGFGVSVRNLGHDGLVVNHEYHHGVTQAVVDGWINTLMFNSMNEGYADCMAALHLDYPFLLKDSYPTDPTAWRDGSRMYMYPRDYNAAQSADPHANGLILFSHCWAVKEKIGRDVAAKLVHHSRYMLSDSNHDFKAYLSGMLEADREFYKGIYDIPVLEAADLRGIDPVGGAQGQRPVAVIEYGDDTKLHSSGEFAIHTASRPTILIARMEDNDQGQRLRGRRWTITQAPEGSELTGEVVFAEELRFGDNFIPDVIGNYSVRLEVSDSGWKISDFEKVVVDVRLAGALDETGAGCQADQIAAKNVRSWLLLVLLVPLLRRRR